MATRTRQVGAPGIDGPRRRPAAGRAPTDAVLRLQRSAGNAAVGRLMRAPKVTPRRTKRLVYVDGSVIDQINRGNKAMADKLRELTKSATVRMTGYNYAEMTAKGDPVLRKANQLLVEDLGIKVDKPLTMAQRTKRGMEAWGDKPRVPKAAVIQPKDVPMVAGVPKGAELWSTDKTIRNAPQRVEEAFNIKIAPESTAIAPDARARPDYAQGRRLLQLDEVVIDADGKLVQRGIQGTVVRSGGVKTQVPSGTTVSGEIGGAPKKPPTSGPGGTSTAAKVGETVVEAETKAGVRLAKGAGKLGLMLLPGPEDALMLMIDFAGSFQEAWATIEQRNTRRGFALGFAAGVLGLESDWVSENLARRFIEADVATRVLGAEGKAEKAFNEALWRGLRYARRHSLEQKKKVLQRTFTVLREEGYVVTDEEELFTIDTVARMARVLTPTVDDVLRQAVERKRQRELREEAARRRERDERMGNVGFKV